VKTDKRLQIQLLGESLVIDGSTPRALPRSRKTRGLLSYLALENRRHRREDLCELLWELPNDPRAALRWSLSKPRQLF
jgi:DNA-binding SARP family transcriptional activator